MAIRIRSNRCPATNHAPVTMTEQGWKVLCACTRSEQKRIDKASGREDGSFCSTCNGKILPPNLTIKTIDEILKD